MVVPQAAIPRDSDSQGNPVLGLSKKHPKTHGFRLCKTGRRRRQGHLRNKAHPEPLPSPRYKAGLPDFVRHPDTRHGLTGILSMPRLCAFVEQIALPRIIQPPLEVAPPALLLTEPTARREGRPYPRSQQVIRAQSRLYGATSKVKSRREKSPPAISVFARGEIIGPPGFTAFFPRLFRLSRQWAPSAPPSWAGLNPYVRESHYRVHHSRRRWEGESTVIDSATASFESRCPECGGDLPRKRIRSRSFPSCRDG